MKEVLIIIITLLITFVPSCLFKNYLENSGNELIEILDLMNDDITKAVGVDEEKTDKLKNIFLEKEKYLILIVNHEILDEIETAIETCIAYYKKADEVEFIANYGVLKHNLEDLSKREEISLQNIL